MCRTCSTTGITTKKEERRREPSFSFYIKLNKTKVRTIPLHIYRSRNQIREQILEATRLDIIDIIREKDVGSTSPAGRTKCVLTFQTIIQNHIRNVAISYRTSSPEATRHIIEMLVKIIMRVFLGNVLCHIKSRSHRITKSSQRNIADHRGQLAEIEVPGFNELIRMDTRHKVRNMSRRNT